MKELNIVGGTTKLTIGDNPDAEIIVNGERMTVPDFLRAVEIGLGVMDGVYTAFDEEGGQL